MMFLRLRLLPLALSIVGPVAATPPPPDQIAANCDAPTYASDVLVCAEPSLLALDLRMRDGWAAVAVTRVASPRALFEAQASWFQRRSGCAFVERHVDCLKAAYAERIAVLDALRLTASSPPHQGTGAICRDAPWGNLSVHLHALAAGALSIDDGDAGVLTVAFPFAAGASWTPYVGFSVEGRTVRLAPIGAAAIACHTGGLN